MELQALARSADAADLIGVRAVLAYAEDAETRGFCKRYGFEPSPTHPLPLVLLMKNIRKTLGAGLGRPPRLLRQCVRQGRQRNGPVVSARAARTPSPTTQRSRSTPR